MYRKGRHRSEIFEHEDDFLDWRFAKETLEDLTRQKKEIEDA